MTEISKYLSLIYHIIIGDRINITFIEIRMARKKDYRACASKKEMCMHRSKNICDLSRFYLQLIGDKVDVYLMCNHYKHLQNLIEAHNLFVIKNVLLCL